MSNRTALIVAIVICLALAYDGVEQDWRVTLFLAGKGWDLLEWMKFWR